MWQAQGSPLLRSLHRVDRWWQQQAPAHLADRNTRFSSVACGVLVGALVYSPLFFGLTIADKMPDGDGLTAATAGQSGRKEAVSITCGLCVYGLWTAAVLRCTLTWCGHLHLPPWILLFYVALYSKSCVYNIQTKARRELVVRKQKLV